MPLNRDAEPSSLTVQDAYAFPMTVTDEQLDTIKALGDGSATHDDVFGFRMVASGDGLDFYFTRQHESSMKNFVKDLQKGQSVLGSHDINTFSYGQSFDAALVNADPTGREYEAAFYRQYSNKPDLATTHYVAGDYFLVRGVTLNGQATDDLIKAMRVGGVRKASISFTVGKYQCGLDGIDMMQSWFGPWPNEDEGCLHFPGVEYKKEGVAWAWMVDNDLLETSLVYKNASPSALMLHKAEILAQRGMLPTSEIGKLEERLQLRLPVHDRTHYPVAKLEDRMTTARNASETEPTTPPPEDPETPETPEGGDTPETPETPETPDSPDTLGAAGGETEEVRTLRSSSAQVATRDTAITEILGEPITVEAVRSLKQQADLGTELYRARVEEAVKGRISAFGADTFDVEKYRAVLLTMRDVAYVDTEISAHAGVKRSTWKEGRQVEPLPTPELPTPSAAAGTEDTTLLGGIARNGRKPAR